MTLRIQEAGMRIVYAPEAIVHTEGPTTLKGLIKQRLRWKRGRLETFALHWASFFGRKKGSNQLFLWMILPLVLLGDIETVCGFLYTIFLYASAVFTRDFSFLLLAMGISSAIFALQVSEERQFRNLSSLVLLPISWFFFQCISLIELDSLIRALYTYYRKRKVKWQQWQRTGVADS